MNSIIYKQTDSRWAKKAYPSGSTVGGCGCGLLACTHIAMEQESKKSWTPDNLRAYMVNKGFAVRGQGTKWEGITETLKYIGHKNVVRIYNDPMSEAWKELNKGNRIGVILFNNAHGHRFTASGHYIAFTGYKYENKKHYFYLKDSGGRNNSGWIPYEGYCAGCIAKVWIVERVGTETKSTTAKATTADGKLVVDGVGGKATVNRLQEFLGVKKTDGITIKKELKKYVPSLTAYGYGTSGSGTVKYLQKWLGISQDGHWGAGTSKALQKKLGVTQDGIFGKASMQALQKYLNSNTKAVYPASKPASTPTPTTNGAKIGAKANEYAYTNNPTTAKYPSGKPTSAYKAALNKAYPNRGSWGTAAKLGASCDVFVGTCVRMAGVDSNFPRGLAEQIPYLAKSTKFKQVSASSAQSGDIIVYAYNGGSHICIAYGGKTKEANHAKTYGITTNTLSARLSTSGKKWVKVYRAK